MEPVFQKKSGENKGRPELIRQIPVQTASDNRSYTFTPVKKRDKWAGIK
jgi:hypothetical protein